RRLAGPRATLRVDVPRRGGVRAAFPRRSRGGPGGRRGARPDLLRGLAPPMQVILRPTRDDAIRVVARVVAKAIRAQPDLVLGLATGVTMERLYALLVAMHRGEGLDFSLVRTFNLDEYVGLSDADPHSYHAYMNQHLFSRVNVDRRNVHLLDG